MEAHGMTSEYELQIDDGLVELRTNFRLCLSPTGPQRTARDRLAAAVRQLSARPGQMLRATLATRDRGRFDPENILF